jgi:hypothetical protein
MAKIFLAISFINLLNNIRDRRSCLYPHNQHNHTAMVCVLTNHKTPAMVRVSFVIFHSMFKRLSSSRYSFSNTCLVVMV